MPYKQFPQPWQGWLQALVVLIFAVIILQFVVGGGWVWFGVVLVLATLQFGLARYARRQM